MSILLRAVDEPFTAMHRRHVIHNVNLALARNMANTMLQSRELHSIQSVRLRLCDLWYRLRPSVGRRSCQVPSGKEEEWAAKVMKE